MTRNRSIVFAIAALVFTFSSCSEYLAPVKDYLEEYTEMVLILDHEITTVWSMDADTVASVPSASPAILRFQLVNSRRYALESSIRFSDPDVESSRTADSCRLALSNDRQSVTVELSPAFLALHEGGGDLSATLTLAEAETGRPFPSYQFALRSNTPPPVPVGSRVMTDSTDNYVVCFNLDLSNAVHQDLSRITINDDIYTITSVTTGAAQDLAFAEGGIATTEPAGGLSAVGSLDPFAPQAGMVQVYVSSGIDSLVYPSMGFTITVFDRRGLSQTFITTTEGDQLPQVRFEETDFTPLAAGTTVTLAAPADLRIINPVSGATVSYTVTRSGTPYYSGSFSDSVMLYTMDPGGYQITARASMPGFLDSDPVTITVNAVSSTLYIASWGADANPGTSTHPMKNVSAAYDRLVNKNDPNNTIVLLTDITAVDGASYSLANLDITETTTLTIDGQGLYGFDAAIVPNVRGMTVTGSGELDLTLSELQIRNAVYWGNGAGLYIYNEHARVVLDDCVIRNNDSSSSSGQGFGAGIYCWVESLTLHGTTVTGNDLSNYTTMNGSGIYVGHGAFFANQGTTITGNTISADNGINKSGYGAGLYIQNSPSVIMNNVTITLNGISGAALVRGSGAGVYVSVVTSMQCTTVLINGNYITPGYNGSDGEGAGLFISSTDCTLAACTISQNVIDVLDRSYGAGVYQGNSSTLNLNGTTISANTGTAAISFGGGLFVGTNGTTTMTLGQITGNSANLENPTLSNSQGDGVYITGANFSESTFTLNSGEISGNQSPSVIPSVTNTAFYLNDQYTTLILGAADVQIPSSNVVFLNNGATIEVDHFMIADQVATLKYPDTAGTGATGLTTTTPAVTPPSVNYYKFQVDNINGNPYCINADGELSEIESPYTSAGNTWGLRTGVESATPGSHTRIIHLTGTLYTINPGESIQVPAGSHIRIIPDNGLLFNVVIADELFTVSGHLLIGGDHEIQILQSTVEREESVFASHVPDISLVLQNVRISETRTNQSTPLPASLVELAGGSAVLEEFHFDDNDSDDINSSTSAIYLTAGSLCHFASGSIDHFDARLPVGNAVAGVATVAPGSTFYIHDGIFTNNSRAGTTSVDGLVENPNGVTLH